MKKFLTLVLLSVLSFSFYSTNLFAMNVQTQDVIDSDGNYIGREYDPVFDKLFEDFDRPLGDVTGTGLWWDSVDGTYTYFTTNHLRADYTTTTGVAYDAPIYKVGSPLNALGSFENLVFEMKGTNGASIDDLVLAFRLNDNYYDIEVDFSSLLDPDLGAMPEFDGTEQTFVVSVINSLDGLEYNLIPDKQGDPVVAADAKVQGIHFMSKSAGTGEGTLELTKVYWTSSPNPVFDAESIDYALLDDFNREDIFEGGDDVWWRGSAFSIVNNHLALYSPLVEATCDAALTVTASNECIDLENKFVFDEFSRAELVPGDLSTIDKWWIDTNATINDAEDALYFDATGNAAQRYRTAGAVNNYDNPKPYLILTMKGTAGTVLESFRITTVSNDTGPAFYNAGNLVDQNGAVIPQITEEYQTYVIDLAASGLAVAHQGIGLFLGDWAAGELFIKEIAYADSVSLASQVQQAVYRSGGYDNSNATGDYDNVVFKVRGLTGTEDVLVAPFYVTNDGDVYGDPVLLSELIGPDQNAVPALTANWQNLVVNFTESGWANNVNGFKFMTPEGQESTVYIDQVFFSNLEYDASLLDTTYPVLDPMSVKVFDHFERDEVGATLDYDPSNPAAIAADLDFIIAYAGLERMSMEDGNLVFDTTTNDAYMQYTVGSQARSNDGTFEYLVFKVKGTDGALLSNFRFQTIDLGGGRSAPTWANGELQSGAGLATVTSFDDEEYPYVDEAGYTYLIVDLVESGLSADVSGFDLFYSGGGKFYIDAIFFANAGSIEVDIANRRVFDEYTREEAAPADAASAGKWWFDTNVTIEDAEDALFFDATNNAGQWYRTAGPDNNNYDITDEYLLLTMKGTAGTTLESFRISTVSNDSGPSFFNAGHLLDPDGNPISQITEEYQTYVIDLARSGLNAQHQGLGIFFGDWAAGGLYVKEIAYASSVNPLPGIQTGLDAYEYPTPLTCEDGFDLVDGVCVQEQVEEPLVCDDDQTEVDGECVDNVVTCQDNQELVNGECQLIEVPKTGCFGSIGLGNSFVVILSGLGGALALFIKRRSV